MTEHSIFSTGYNKNNNKVTMLVQKKTGNCFLGDFKWNK